MYLLCNYYMEIKIIQIGNSKGIRLSKTMMEKYKFEDSLELEMTPEGLLLKPLKSSRKDWDQAFKQMHKTHDDRLLIPDVLEDDVFEKW